MHPGDKIVVTGASGFIGLAVCKALAAAGYSVMAVSRNSVTIPGIRCHQIPALNREYIDAPFDSARAVVHLAARAHVFREKAPDPIAEFRAVNVEVTREVLGAATNAGVDLFVFLSSVAAVAHAGDAISDSAVPKPATPYGVSKLEAEEVVRRQCAETGMRTVILRPPLVFGPGMKGNPLRLFKAIQAGIPLPLGGVRNRRSMLFVGNLAAGIVAALSGAPDGENTYLIADQTELSTPDFIRAAAAAMGRPARLFSLPAASLRFAAALSRHVPGLPSVSRDSVDSILGSLTVDSSRFWRTMGLEPPYSPGGAMECTASWFKGVTT